MSTFLRFKASLIRTPLQKPATLFAEFLRLPHRLRHPELKGLFEEPHFLELAIRKLNSTDSNCIDIGCHIGSVLSVFVKIAPKGNHIAFEPVPDKAAFLMKKFPDVQVHQVALSDEAGEAEFHEDLSRSGYSSLAKFKDSNAPSVKYRVKVSKLDDIIPAEHNVNFIKIDVEGAEILVLKGAVRTIDRCRPAIVFENGQIGPEKFGFTHADLFRFVTQTLNYHVFKLRDFIEDQPPLSEEAFHACRIYPFQAQNFLALPVERYQK